jgi:hypothetical protein
LPLIDYEDICWGDRGNENIDKWLTNSTQ